LSRRLRVISLLVGLLSVAASADGSAPEPLGFKIGDGRLHPFLEADGRYDSMIGFFTRAANGAALPSSEFIIHARPGLKFNLENPSTLVGFKGSAEYLFYTGILSPSSRQLSRIQADVGLNAAFNRDGAVEFQIDDTLTRSDRANNPLVGTGVLSLYNNVSIAAPIRPGGRALEITPRASWQVEFFDPLVMSSAVVGCSATDISCNPALVKQMNYSNLNFGLRGKWKFLPKTAFLLDSSFDLRTYFAGTTQNRPADLLRVQVGLLGLITPRLSATVLAGYAGEFLGSNLHTVIGNAEVNYVPFQFSKLTLGYLRTAQPVPVVGVYINDNGYLRARVGVLDNRLYFAAEGTVSYYTFFNTRAVRNDLVISGLGGLGVVVTSWFEVSAHYGLSFRSSTSTALTSVNYTRHEATLRLNLHY
jgi:hypothetical protein